MTSAVHGLSMQWIYNELVKHSPPGGDWSDWERIRLEESERNQLVAEDYAPGIGPNPCRSPAEALERISTWLYHEFDNRLEEPAPEKVTEAICHAARLAATNLSTRSRLEIRAALAHILRRVGFPALSRSFMQHNERINALCCASGGSSLIGKRDWLLYSWLLFLASANQVEVWPSEHLSLTPVAAWEPIVRENRAFGDLAELLLPRLEAGVPVGLFTDNHGEIIADLSFLSWLQQQGAGMCFLFPKGCPVETDVDGACVERLKQRSFNELRMIIVPEGSTSQGNLLTEFSRPFRDTLSEIQARQGVLIIKGLANLESVPGILVDCLFLFTAKTERVACALGVQRRAAVGLFTPAGRRIQDVDCILRATHPARLRAWCR